MVADDSQAQHHRGPPISLRPWRQIAIRTPSRCSWVSSYGAARERPNRGPRTIAPVASATAAPPSPATQEPRLKNVLAEPMPSKEARAPPTTAPPTPLSRAPGSRTGLEPSRRLATVHPATTPSTTQAAKPTLFPFQDRGSRAPRRGASRYCVNGRRERGPRPSAETPIRPSAHTPTSGERSRIARRARTGWLVMPMGLSAATGHHRSG